MKARKMIGVATATALAVMVGCGPLTPVVPKKPVPAGTFQIHFTRKLLGPLDIMVDGTRIHVEQKKKKARTLTISGLAIGKHSYFISGYREIIGPDIGEFEISPDAGLFQVHYAKRLKLAFANPSVANAPAAEGIPGVRAVLE